jgi:hypothetical protein
MAMATLVLGATGVASAQYYPPGPGYYYDPPPPPPQLKTPSAYDHPIALRG